MGVTGTEVEFMTSIPKGSEMALFFVFRVESHVTFLVGLRENSRVG